ncbi:hypothetical protein Tco_1505410 [Tanacetum coccineum]
MTREAVNELIECRVAEALEARNAARNLEPLVKGGGEQEDGNRGNRNKGVNRNGGNRNGGENGNGNGNRNGGGNGHNFGGLMPVAREMISDEEDKVERFIRGLPDNIQGNVIAAEPTRL